MNADYLQQVRYKLQNRVARLNTSNATVFHYSIRQLWNFLTSVELIRSVTDDLKARWPSYPAAVEPIVKHESGLVFDNEDEHAVAAYYVLEHCISDSDQMAEVRITYLYPHSTQSGENIEFFKEFFVEPLYEYVDEHLDDTRNLLAMLIRYKRSVEWFRKDQLRSSFLANTDKGEGVLAYDLYEYLYDQGLEFHIEPVSASGRTDLISSQTGDERLVLDAKVYAPDRGRGKSYLLKGFNQVYSYTLDYNEPVGYLVIFQITGDSLSLSFDTETAQAPFVAWNNKTIFFLVVDLRAQMSASKRGTFKTTVITSQDLIASAGEHYAESVAIDAPEQSDKDEGKE